MSIDRLDHLEQRAQQMPGTGKLAHVRAVAEQIYQVRLPLPFALNHVNCYLLDDGDGWTLVDTGLHTPEIVAAWEAAWAELGIARRHIHRIVLTHMHPDHFGLAGWLQRETGAPVFLSPRERELAEITWIHDQPGERRRAAMARYFHSGGISPDVGAIVAKQQDHLRRLTLPHPVEMGVIAPGETVAMGGRTFRAIHAPGHADGQLIFYCADDLLLLSGDQVLMKITPNIGVWPTSEPNPLARYLCSLAELKSLEVALALPGHQKLITDWRGRLEELIEHHAHRIEFMFAAAKEGATALEVSLVVFNFDRFSQHEVRFAVAEALAHLEYLAEEGRLVRVEEAERRIYRAA